MYKGLLIDLGNTIIYNEDFDFTRGLICIYNHVNNAKVSLEQFLTFAKQFTKHTYDNRELFEIYFINLLNYIRIYFDFSFDISLEELEIEFAKSCEKISLIPGVKDVLDYFYNQNKKIVILSNSTFSAPALLSQLKSLQIDYYFDTLLSSADCIYRKPHPYFFQLGIKCLDLKEEEILYIGNDYYYDVIGAHNANIDCCWYNEYSNVNKQNIKCLNVKSYFELLDYLRNL